MGKCLSCCKEDQNFQQNRFEDQVISEPQHYGASSSSQPRPSLGLKTAHCSATLKVSSHRGSRKLSSLSSTSSFKSARSFFSERRQSLFARFQGDHTSLFRQQSRANFDYQDLNFNKVQSSSEHFDGFRSQRLFSSPKLSIVSCHKSALFFDPQSSETMINVNEIEIFSKKPNDTDVQRHITFSAPECSSVHFMNTEAGTASSLRRSTNDKLSSQQNTASFSRPICTSSACQPNGITTDIQQSGQLSKDQQHPFQNVTSHPRRSVGFSSSCRSAGSLIPRQSEGPSEDGNCPVSSQDEARSSPFEIPKIRYTTANTDTEEQSFPIPKAFNTHTEELTLDVLLQKADHLRVNENGKVESFELLCDHKEKFRDEIEFIWRFTRAYGDMYELSTNTQERKHYANVGKTLGERAIARAPTNGYCHLWYAILCGYVSELEGLQSKINCGYHFKEHLDIAIQLLPQEPLLYYLKGRYCYTVSRLSWIEKKMAATVFGKIPTSTVQEALNNFLKAEELHPGYSKPNYMYLAKCYIDLGENQNALKFSDLALVLPVVTKEDKEAQKEVKKIITSLKR
ncbi:regulator of microtubule dynamics protein 2 isoform X1 [Tupaia chinensis]|uniref:regulator of microtubule dynamics protein 2 isoform X1 n=1 Tax=Tupaia chinensis TaxID=246437 RepID=UPI0003C8F85F|nr:regulator of microtubule dynamics protein 2 isoform X1 [Tupaia chinensis]